MGKILDKDTYGLINGVVFEKIDFSLCSFQSAIPRIEVERTLFRCTEIKFITKGSIDIDSVKYDLYEYVIEYFDENHRVRFTIEVRSGVLYVISVTRM